MKGKDQDQNGNPGAAGTEGEPVRAAESTAGGDLVAGDGLIAGIRNDARSEAERLIEEARKAAEERLQAAESQSSRILEEARGKAEAQAGTVHAQALSTTRMEDKRNSLKVREQALRGVLQAVRDKLASRSGAGDYRKVLLGWIIEAAIGLNVPEATVNVSAPERKLLERDLLQTAERTVEELTGRKVALKPAEGNPLVGQGVVLRSADGRLEFNNQVSTRLLRYQSEIRKIVFEALDR